ncbi:internal scaffolding protein [robinz microvirus RP_121]|nr:internal scaffolding protein [robinz microvirus RP_121]
MHFRTPYKFDTGDSFATVNNEESLTQQSDARDCDINVIMERYGVSGTAPQVITKPNFGDFREVTDYRTALDLVRAADAEFKNIPAKIRATFENDPAEFIQFAADPENIEQMRKWKLAPPAPKPVPSATPAPSPANSEGTSHGTPQLTNTNFPSSTNEPTQGSRGPSGGGA